MIEDLLKAAAESAGNTILLAVLIAFIAGAVVVGTLVYLT